MALVMAWTGSRRLRLSFAFLVLVVFQESGAAFFRRGWPLFSGLFETARRLLFPPAVGFGRFFAGLSGAGWRAWFRLRCRWRFQLAIGLR